MKISNINGTLFFRHNTVVMMEMQDTINALQRELSSIRDTQPQSSPEQVNTMNIGKNDVAYSLNYEDLGLYF